MFPVKRPQFLNLPPDLAEVYKAGALPRGQFSTCSSPRRESSPSERRILIADDDVGLIRLLAIPLERMGLKILEAHDAMYALNIIHKTPPDLVILDVNMPAGNGLSACEMLGSDPRFSRLPVVILTGDSSDATMMRCQKMRAHYVCKGPDAVNEVKRLVYRLLSIPDPEDPSPANFHG